MRTYRYLLDVLEQALWALRENRLRSLLSLLGITMGVAAVMAVGAIGRGGHHLVFSELQTFGLEAVWVYRRHDDKDPRRAVREGTGIDNQDYGMLRQGCCPAVRRVTPLVHTRDPRFVIRRGNRYNNATLTGVGVDYLPINDDQVVFGRPFRLPDETRHRAVAIIGPEARDDLFGKSGNPVGQEIRINNRKFTVIGLLRGKSRDFLASIGSEGGQNANNRVLIPYSVLQQMIGNKAICLLQGQARAVRQADRAVAEIIALLQRNHNRQYAYESETLAQYIDTANRILQGVSMIGVVAASVSLLVGGMGIMNIMGTAVLERTREIGLRRALGARRRDILIQFSMEAVVISLAGGLVGLSVGMAASYALASWTGFPLTPAPHLVAVALLASMGVGLASGYSPAHRAAALRPVAALRYESGFVTSVAHSASTYCPGASMSGR